MSAGDEAAAGAVVTDRSRTGRGQRWATERWVLTGILVLAGLLRLVLLIAARSNLAGLVYKDSAEYVALGKNFTTGYGSREGELFDLGLRRPPGYPGFLSVAFTLTGNSLFWATFIQAAVAVVTVYLTYRLAAAVSGSQVAGLAAAALVAVDPLSVTNSNFIGSETLFALVLVAAVWAWWVALTRQDAWRQAVAGGLLIALAALVRPVALYLPVLMAAVLALRWWRSGRAALVLAVGLLVGSLVPVAAWTARNYAVTGVPTFTTIEGLNMLRERAAGALSVSDGISLDQARYRLARELGRRLHLSDDVAQQLKKEALLFEARRYGVKENAAELSQEETKLGLRVITQHPVGYLRSAAKGAQRTIVGPGQTWVFQLLGYRHPFSDDTATKKAIAAPVIAFLLLLYALVLVGVVTLVRERAWATVVVLVGPLAYLLIVSAGPEAYSRFRVPMVPLLAVLGGVGAARLLRTRLRLS